MLCKGLPSAIRKTGKSAITSKPQNSAAILDDSLDIITGQTFFGCVKSERVVFIFEEPFV
jgi:hypothetical protein